MAQSYLITRDEGGAHLEFGDFPDAEDAPGDVLIEVHWSSLNYKDALALRGDPGVARVSPLVPGIDTVGVVLESADPRWGSGDEVVLTGAGAGETRHGGYSTRVRVDADALVRVPPGLGSRRVAAIGTAGFTAAQAVLALEHHGIPDGPVIVTGASGGVGSVAIALLAASGREVIASTGDPDRARDRLTRLGAATVIDRRDLQHPGRPLQSAAWSGGIDSVGGVTLATLLARTRYGGAIAACGLVESAELDTTVMPFILRAVSLLGVNSVDTPMATRHSAWERLERDLDLELLDQMTTEIPLADLPQAAAAMLAGGSRGRTVVAVPH